MGATTWVEVSSSALRNNIEELRRAVGESCILAPVVKGNAYGHGLELAARAFVDAGADWLCVHELDEARRVRGADLDVPIYVLGYVPLDDLAEAVALDVRIVVYNVETVEAAGAAGVAAGRPLPLHIKVETGNHRQGLEPGAAIELARRVEATPGVLYEGVATHFADIEDTTDHTYAQGQVEGLRGFVEALRAEGLAPPMIHCANSAATILWPSTHGAMVRAGIAAYGMWPSKETLISALLTDRERIDLRPALTWKSRVVQVKDVPAGAYVGYGRTFRTTHRTRLAVIGVGYYDGYDRRLSNQAYVLIRGHRAPVRGRVCMNLVMVDVTDVPDVVLEEEVVLLGRSGTDAVSAEQLAEWIGTINYEVTTRIGERIPRVAIA